MSHVREALGVIVLAVVAGLPLLKSDLPLGYDPHTYPPRIVEFHQSVRTGDLLPVWAPDLSGGLGQPFFLFTPPLLHWLAEPFYALTGSASRALNLACFSLLVLGTFSVRRLGLELSGEMGGWAAAAAWTFAPYTLTDIYVRTALAEHSALCVLPFALLGLTVHSRTGSRRALALAALGTGLVGLAHHITTLIAAPLLLAWALFLATRARSFRLLAQHVGAFTLGAALSGCTWLPSMLLFNQVHLDRAILGHYDFHNHFVTLRQLVGSSSIPGRSPASTADGIPVALGYLHTVFAAAAVVFAWRLHRRRESVAFLTTLVIVTCLLMLRVSLPIWETMPIFSRVQFPWRLLGVVTLALSLLAGITTAFIKEICPARAQTVVGLLIVATIVENGLPHAEAESFLNPGQLAQTPEEIARRGASVTSVEEFEPRTVVKRAPASDRFAEARAGVARSTIIERTPTRLQLDVDARTAAELTLQLHDFVGWDVEGRAAKLPPEPRTGRIRLRVDAGRHEILLVRHRTPAEQLGIATSIAAMLSIASLAIMRRRTGVIHWAPVSRMQ